MKRLPSAAQVVLYTLALLVVVAVGLAGGHLLRGLVPDSDSSGSMRDMQSLLEVDAVFPDVELLSLQGERRRTRELLQGQGGIVLFLDPECGPCAEMALRWQEAIDAGVISSNRVFGISNRPPDQIVEFQDDNGLSFGILHDPGNVFHDEYRVTWLPLEVVVGLSGHIQSANCFYGGRVNRVELRSQLHQ